MGDARAEHHPAARGVAGLVWRFFARTAWTRAHAAAPVADDDGLAAFSDEGRYDGSEGEHQDERAAELAQQHGERRRHALAADRVPAKACEAACGLRRAQAFAARAEAGKQVRGRLRPVGAGIFGTTHVIHGDCLGQGGRQRATKSAGCRDAPPVPVRLCHVARTTIAAVDRDFGAGDIARFVRGQVKGGGRDLRRAREQGSLIR